MTGHIPETLVAGVPEPLPDRLVVLDVREDDEWQAGHIDGAVHIPLMQLPGRVAQLPIDRQVLVVCKVGGRSAQAVGFLTAQGVDAVNLAGGMYAWSAANRPMVAEGAHPPFVG